jgi:hypothetical protein
MHAQGVRHGLELHDDRSVLAEIASASDAERRASIACAPERQVDQRRERVRSGRELHEIEGCPVMAPLAVGMGGVSAPR